MTADEVRHRRIVGEGRRRAAGRARTRHEPGFEENLRAVADAENELAGARTGGDAVHRRVVRCNGTGAYPILVRESAGQHVGVERVERSGARPVHEFGIAAAVAQHPQRLLFRVRPRKDEHRDATHG